MLLVGLGHLGRPVLDLLAASPWLGRVVAGRRSRAAGEAACRMARLSGLALGDGAPEVEFAQLDVADAARTAELVERVRPDLVLHTASLQTWWWTGLLPEEAARPLRGIGFGAWLPLHLPVTLALMRSLAGAGWDGPVLSAPFPDVTGPILERLGLAPTSGVGNVAEIVPKLRHLAGARLGVPPADVEVTLVGHHALLGTSLGREARPPAGEVPPHHLRIRAAGEDVTDRVDAESLLVEPWPLPGGAAWGRLTAACTLRLVRAVLSPGTTRLHAPSPGGLPGGYPVLAGDGEVRPAPIEGLSLEEAVELNRRSHRFDGIDAIEPDGTVVLTDGAAGALRDTLGFECPRVRPDEAADLGRELAERFRAYAARHGVELPGRASGRDVDAAAGGRPAGAGAEA